MASIGHLAAGACVGALLSRLTPVRPSWAILGGCFLALSPDLDLLTSRIGIAGVHFLRHRAMTHSLVFAFVVALMIGLAFRRRYPGARVGLFAFLAIGSHGLLDTLSLVGDGPRLLWPFLDAGVISPWQVVPGVATAADYFSILAVPTFLVELLVFAPLVVATVVLLMQGSEKREEEKGDGEEGAGSGEGESARDGRKWDRIPDYSSSVNKIPA
ncbi:MAG: metal-dependent hydrolase [Gemmatimonadales bacterium]